MGFFFKFLLTTFLWGLVGAIGGFVVGFAITQGLFVSWTPAPLPGGSVLGNFQPVSSPGESLSSLGAVSADGQQFYFDMSIDRAGEKWVAADSNAAGLNFFGSCATAPQHDRFWMRSPPAAAAQQIDCQSMWSDIVLYHRFIQLENGEVWLWRHSGGLNNLFTLFFAVMMPCIALAFIGSVIFGVNQYRRISQELPPPEQESPT